MAHTAYAEDLRFELRVTLLDPVQELEQCQEAVAAATAPRAESAVRPETCSHDWPAELDTEAACLDCGLAYVEWSS